MHDEPDPNPFSTPVAAEPRSLIHRANRMDELAPAEDIGRDERVLFGKAYPHYPRARRDRRAVHVICRHRK